MDVAARLHLFILYILFLRGEGVRYIAVCVCAQFPIKITETETTT